MNKSEGCGCSLITGGILFTFVSLMGWVESSWQLATFTLGMGMLFFPVLIKVTGLNTPNPKPKNPPKPTVQTRPSLTRQDSFSSPTQYRGSSYDRFWAEDEPNMTSERREDWAEGYQEGYEEGLASGYALGSEETWDDHIPEGAEWRHPDDDPTDR